MRDLTFGRAGGIRRLGFLFIIACLLLVRAGAASVDPALKSEVEKRLLQEFPSLSALYKDLHSSPEISFQEKKTADKIAQELTKLGCTVTKNIGGYGVVGVLR